MDANRPCGIPITSRQALRTTIVNISITVLAPQGAFWMPHSAIVFSRRSPCCSAGVPLYSVATAMPTIRPINTLRLFMPNIRSIKIWNGGVDAGVGGAFALHRAGDSTHFFGTTEGIVHVSLRVSRTLKLGGYPLPLHAEGLWNPQSDKAYFQIGAQLFSF